MKKKSLTINNNKGKKLLLDFKGTNRFTICICFTGPRPVVLSTKENNLSCKPFCAYTGSHHS